MKPGNYVWRTKHTDQPVTVIKLLGKGPDGRTYAQIAGTNTGVPVDELVLAPQPRGYSFKDLFRKLMGL